MTKFNRDSIEMFLGVLRKYMQVRGNLSQKDLAELIDVGVSTISRFINQKTKDLDAQLIAKIVAALDVPMHEIIDFVEEDSEDRFKKMVKFYKEMKVAEGGTGGVEFSEEEPVEPSAPGGGVESPGQPDEYTDAFGDALGLGGGGTAKENVTAKVRIGGKSRSIPFSTEGSRRRDMSIREKLASLSPRQKAYLADFLNLDVEGRDLLVDLGNSLFRYFRQKGREFDF